MKKEHKDKTNADENKGPEKKQETLEEMDKRMTLYAYVIIGLIALTIIVASIFLINNYLGKHFTYEGMEFDRILKSNVKTYTTSFTIKGFMNGTFYTDNRSFYFRNDPRTINLENAPESISIMGNKLVYVSLDEPLPYCKDNFIASYELGASLKVYGFDIKGAVINATKAQKDYPEITCANSTLNTVILISPGNVTEIKQIDDNCYGLSYKDCEILKVTEGFSLILLKQAAKEQSKS
jgi:hypothetical protein